MRKIGDRFEIDEKTLEVRKAAKTGRESCCGCYFEDKDCIMVEDLKCCSIMRDDRTDVIFVEVGE